MHIHPTPIHLINKLLLRLLQIPRIQEEVVAILRREAPSSDLKSHPVDLLVLETLAPIPKNHITQFFGVVAVNHRAMIRQELPRDLVVADAVRLLEAVLENCHSLQTDVFFVNIRIFELLEVEIDETADVDVACLPPDLQNVVFDAFDRVQKLEIFEGFLPRSEHVPVAGDDGDDQPHLSEAFGVLFYVVSEKWLFFVFFDEARVSLLTWLRFELFYLSVEVWFYHFVFFFEFFCVCFGFFVVEGFVESVASGGVRGAQWDALRWKMSRRLGGNWLKKF